MQLRYSPAVITTIFAPQRSVVRPLRATLHTGSPTATALRFTRLFQRLAAMSPRSYCRAHEYKAGRKNP